jgi:hypothetical protein
MERSKRVREVISLNEKKEIENRAMKQNPSFHVYLMGALLQKSKIQRFTSPFFQFLLWKKNIGNNK